MLEKGAGLAMCSASSRPGRDVSVGNERLDLAQVSPTPQVRAARHSPAERCLLCGEPLQLKKTGRAPKYCSARCRDKAREARTFALRGVARVRGGLARLRGNARDASLTVPGMPDSAVPRNAVAGVLVPLDLIGHASRRFDNALRLDPVLVRAVLSTELPATVTPNSGEGAKDAGPHSADRVIENERQTRSGTPPIARSDRAVTSLPETEPVTSEPAGALATTDDEP